MGLIGCVGLPLVVIGWLAFISFSTWYHDYDGNRIDPVLRRALLAHVPKGTRLPVTLWSGPRVIEIKLAFHDDRTGPFETPTTCVNLDVLDPKTEARDPKYPTGTARCITGVAVTIR